MITLNLTAMTTNEIIIKDYLENNVSETLAEKINNGVRIEKDGKTFINKKTLKTFWEYAGKEAQKEVTQKSGMVVVPVYKDAIFNWAIHYFEEDSIEGQLYNLDGTEYKPPVPVKAVKPSATKSVAVTQAKAKPMDLFDMMAAQNQETRLAEFETGEPEIANLEEDEQEVDEAEFVDEEQDATLDELEGTNSATPPNAISKPVVDANPVSKVQEQLREHIAEKYKHPTNNIIICGMPPVSGSKSTDAEPIPSEVDKSKLIQISDTKCADASTGVVYERPAADAVPSFISKLFGNALKIEVGK